MMEVPIPRRLTHPHPLVARLRDVSTPHRRSSSEPVDLRYGNSPGYRVETPRDSLRPLDVTRHSLQRALRLIQALIDESRRRGYEIRESKPSPSRTTEVEIVIEGHGFAVSISEKDSKLRLWLPQAYGGRRQWNDGPRGLIDSKLGDMLESLEERVQELEERRRAWEAEERRREEARQRAIQTARERYAEAFRADELRRQIKARRLASAIRAYCDELRARVATGSAPSGAMEWIDWAEAHAGRVDPLVEIPTMPEVPEPGPEDLRPFLHGLQAVDQYWRL